MDGVWRPRRLAASEKGACRALWEEIFAEDSKEFLDYYDRWKYTENECYGIFDEGRLVSMVQLNPYEMQVRGGPEVFQAVESRYIIAVATREEYRHRGMMAALLKESLGEMRKRGMPFVFLMPAAEAIYYPFGFRYFYESNTGTMEPCGTDETEAGAELSVRPAVSSDIPDLAAFAEKIQPELFDCYTRRDCHYYEMLLPELASEGGGLLLVTQTERPEESGGGESGGPAEKGLGHHGRIVASVPCWGTDPVEIREVLCRPEDKERVLSALGRWFFSSRTGKRPERVSVVGAAFELEKKKPVIMGRLVDAAGFLELFSAERPMEIILELSDRLLEENCGIYRWKLSPEGSRAERIGHLEEQMLRAAEVSSKAGAETGGAAGGMAGDMPHGEKIQMTAAELFSCLMGGAELEGALGKVRRCRKHYINEIV